MLSEVILSVVYHNSWWHALTLKLVFLILAVLNESSLVSGKVPLDVCFCVIRFFCELGLIHLETRDGKPKKRTDSSPGSFCSRFLSGDFFHICQSPQRAAIASAFVASLIHPSSQWDPYRCRWFRESTGGRLTRGKPSVVSSDTKHLNRRGEERWHRYGCMRFRGIKCFSCELKWIILNWVSRSKPFFLHTGELETLVKLVVLQQWARLTAVIEMNKSPY